MLAQKDSGVDAEGNTVYYSDAEYFGGYGYVYFVGIDGGATFFNNYIAPEIDFAGRLAGALLIRGEMQEIRRPSIFVPMYMVNADEDVLDKYFEANASTPCAPRATSSPITIRPGRCARSSSATWTPWTPPR